MDFLAQTSKYLEKKRDLKICLFRLANRYLSSPINSQPLTYDDCCLLFNITLNSERIFNLLVRRFKSNSTRTSFDFKSFLPEQPSNNAKVSRSLLRFIPNKDFNNEIEENALSDSSSSEEEDNEEVVSTNDDDYLNELAEWEPENFQPVIENDDDDDDDGEDEDEDESVIQSIDVDDNNVDNHTNQMDHSSGIGKKSKTSFVNRIKTFETFSIENR